MNELRTLDLFSGIGGFSYALERLCPAGPFRTVAFCEQDPFCQAVLRKHWPDTPVYDDVRTIPTDELGRIDIITGGFPCQPWSVAGQQRGAEDDRDLWPQMLRVIEAVQSRWLIGENVRGFVNEPMGLERSLSDLARIGYEAVPFVIPACAVDAPHRRDRVWIVGHSKNKRHKIRKDVERTRQKDKQIERPHVRSKFSGSGKVVADADDARSQGRQETSNAGSKRTRRDELTQRCSDGEGSVRIAQQCLGLPPDGLPGWVAGDWERGVSRVAHKEEGRAMKLQALGNSIVPQVVAQIGRAIVAAEGR